MNFPFLCGIIPAAPAYGLYISRLIRYSRVYIFYHYFYDRRLLFTRKLWNREFQVVKLKSSFVNFTNAITNWLYVLKMTKDMFDNPVPFSLNVTYQIYHRVWTWMSHTTDAACNTGCDYPSRAPQITPSFKLMGLCCSVFYFLCTGFFLYSLFIYYSLFILYCLVCSHIIHCIACSIFYLLCSLYIFYALYILLGFVDEILRNRLSDQQEFCMISTQFFFRTKKP